MLGIFAKNSHQELYTFMQTKWHCCLRKQNHVVKKFYAKPKVFGCKFYSGLRVEDVQCGQLIQILIEDVVK